MHITIACRGRRAFFVDVALADDVTSMLRDNSETVAAVLMPDHLHWLLSSAEGLSRRVARFKSLSTRCAWRRGHRGRLWQRSFFDSLIRGRKSLRAQAEYMLNNPVRAGLALEASCYRWSVVHLDRIPG